MVFAYATIFDGDNYALENYKGKIYVHSSGNKIFQTPKESLDYVADSLRREYGRLNRNLDFFNAILWSDSSDVEIMDFFGYHNLKNNWKGNPDIKSWVVRNGVWEKENPITCGEGIILLGKEEELRRGTKNLREYLSEIADIYRINNIINQP